MKLKAIIQQKKKLYIKILVGVYTSIVNMKKKQDYKANILNLQEIMLQYKFSNIYLKKENRLMKQFKN